MQNVISKILFVVVVFIVAFFAYKTINSTSMKPTSVVITQTEGSTIDEEEKVKSIIKKYLMESPEIIIQSIEGLQKRKTQELEGKVNSYLDNNKDELENSSGFPVVGNQQGDITIVSFYDYNCSYCKKGDYIIEQLLKNDNNVKFILRPLPVLGDASNYLSKIILAVYKVNPGKFLSIHQGLISMNAVTKESVEDLLRDNALNIAEIEEVADNKEVNDLLKKNADIAKNLRIQGVPAYIINSRLIPGLMDLPQLKTLIQNIRENK